MAGWQAAAVVSFADRLVEAVGRKRSQLVVGLDPVVESLPSNWSEVELDAPRAAAAFARFCCGIVDAVAPSPSRSSRSRVLRGARARRRRRLHRGLRLRARRRADRHRRREARRHRLDRARLRGRVRRAPRRGPAARGRGHRQPVPRPRLARAVPRRLPARGRRALLPRQDLEPRRGEIQDAALSDGRPVWQHVARLVGSGATSSSARTGSRRSARSSERPIRARSPRHGGCCRRRCSCSPASARRARVRPTSGPRSRRGRAGGLVYASRSVIYAHERAAATGVPPQPPRPSGSPRDLGRLRLVMGISTAASSRISALRSAFLLGVTVAVLLSGPASAEDSGASTTRSTRSTTRSSALLEADEDGDGARATGTIAAGPRYYTVQKGDTFGAIAVRGRDDGAALEKLNPGVSSNASASGRRSGSSRVAPRDRHAPAARSRCRRGGRARGVRRPGRRRASDSPGPAWYVVDGANGEVLASIDRGLARPIASITKLMTVIVALKHLSPADTVTVTAAGCTRRRGAIPLTAGPADHRLSTCSRGR